MHTDSTPIIGYVFLAAMLLMAVSNVFLGAYLFYQFFASLKGGRPTNHWAGIWAVGWLLFLAGLPTIFIGGIMLIFASTGAWAFAAWRCWRGTKQKPSGAALPETHTEGVWPPPPDIPAI